ncbi:hypothetical protein GWA97_03090 [Flavobacterium sp. LaA7.5]|nr:hypothetical protein [Flavobacterium salilacus subsp. altitudinum]
MKIIKYIFLLLLLILVAFTVFIATQDGSYDIRQEKIVKVPKTALFNYINDYANWETSNILADVDSTTVYTRIGTETSGKGASINWKTGQTEGSIQTVETIKDDSITQYAYTDNNNKQEILWTFKDTLNGTKVSVRVKGKLTFTEKAYSIVRRGTENRTEEAMKQGLTRIGNFMEQELTNYNIMVMGKSTKTEDFYLGYSITSDISSIEKNIAIVLPKLTNFIKTNNISIDGPPFVMYKKYKYTGSNKTTYTICIPIKEEIITSAGSEFGGGVLKSFSALKTTVKGDYSHLKKAWDTTRKYSNDKAIKTDTLNEYIEVYRNNTQQSKNPSEWITDIYFPIVPDSLINITPPTIHPVDATRQRQDRTSSAVRAARDTTP